jgi:hypothetical protein
MQPGGTYVKQLVFTETVANLAAVSVDFLGVATFLAQSIIPIKSGPQTMDSSHRHKLSSSSQIRRLFHYLAFVQFSNHSYAKVTLSKQIMYENVSYLVTTD